MSFNRRNACSISGVTCVDFASRIGARANSRMSQLGAIEG